MHVGLVGEVISEGPSSFNLFTTKLSENLTRMAPDSFKLTLIRSEQKHTLLKIRKGPVYSRLRTLLSPQGLELGKCGYDLIHMPHMGGGSSPSFMFSLSRLPLVVTMHGIAPLSVPPDYYFENIRDHCLYRSLYTYFRFVYNRLKKRKNFVMVTVSKSEKKNIKKYLRIPEEKIKVVYNGVDHSTFRVLERRSEIERNMMKRYGVKPPYIFHVSRSLRLKGSKNLPTILQAFQILKRHHRLDHKLVLAGEISHVNRLLGTLNCLGLQGEVILLGYIPNRDLSKLHNCADLFVLPSLHEGCPISVLEAMACGTPVVGSNTFGTPEIVGNAGKLVDPLNVNALAKAMLEVITDEAVKRNLVKRGLERARMFTWEKCAKEYLKVYEDVLR